TTFAKALGNKLAQSLSLAEAFAGTLASEQRYRTLMENAPDAITILTLDGTVREVNRAWEEVFGHSAAEAVGSHIDAFASPGHESGNLQSFHYMAATRIRGSAPVPLRRADSSEMLMEFNLSKIEVGGETLVLSIGRDVTAQVQAQSQLILADRMVSIGMLAAGVAHEVNNPLPAVAGNLELAAADLERLRPAAGGTAAFELL